MTVEITLLISIISVSAAVFFGIKSMKRADVEDIEERAKDNAKIIVKLDNLLQIVSQMQTDIKELTTRLSNDEKATEKLVVKYEELEKRIERLEQK